MALAETSDPRPPRTPRTPRPRPNQSLVCLALDYIDTKTREGRFRGATPSKRRSVLLLFADILDNPPPASLSRRHIVKWMSARPLSPNTLRSQLSTVRGFCDWLVEEGHLASNPCDKIPPPRVPRLLPRGLPSDSISRLLAQLPDARAELIISLMVQEGLRCVEVSRLQYGDIDFSSRTLVAHGKGGHERVLPISDDTWLALSRYLDSTTAIAGPLIRSERDPYSPLSPAYISLLVTRWMRMAGIKSGRARDGVSAHALRHTAATDMLRHGAHVRDVQAALGHTSLATTQRYMPLVVHSLREAMGGRSYRPVDQPSDRP